MHFLGLAAESVYSCWAELKYGMHDGNRQVTSAFGLQPAFDACVKCGLYGLTSTNNCLKNAGATQQPSVSDQMPVVAKHTIDGTTEERGQAKDHSGDVQVIKPVSKAEKASKLAHKRKAKAKGGEGCRPRQLKKQLGQAGRQVHEADQVDEHTADWVDKHAADQVDEHEADQVDEHEADQVDEHAADQVDEHAAEQVDEHPLDQLHAHPLDQLHAHPCDQLHAHPCAQP